jgi:PAS domain S-box-containing protein
MFYWPVKRPTPVMLSLVMIALLICQTGAPALAQPAPPLGTGGGSLPRPKTISAGSTADLSKKSVLLLHAYTYETASYIAMDPIFVKSFLEAGLEGNRLNFEFLDLSKHPDPDHRLAFVNYLERKYEKQPIDLVIALHPAALQFLVEEGGNLFPGVPVINVIADPEFIGNGTFRTTQIRRMERLKRPFILLPFSINADATVKNIASLQPDTRTLVVITGSDYLDRRLEQTVQRSLAAWQGRFQIEYLSAKPLEEVLERVAALPPKSAILFTNFSAAPQERTHRPPDVVQRISRTAKAPVFGLFDTLLGNNGVVGGTMPSFAREAKRTIELALEILQGQLPAEPVTFTHSPVIPMFDWKELQRWGLDEKRLPPGSIVLNRPRTLWSEYKGFVIGSLLVILMLTSLVIGLLVQGRLKRKAELSLIQKTEELDQFFNVTLDLFCIASTEGYFLRLNPAWETALGYTREELLTKKFLDFVHPDDVEGTGEVVSTLASQQKVNYFENRYRCKDGSYRWLQWSASPAGKLIYAAARDVTERKQVEQALQKNERILRQNQNNLRELTGRLISAQEEERRHLARELHDDLTQRLAVLSIDAGKLEQQLTESPDPVKEKLREMKNQLIAIAGDINNLARQLHPSILDDLGLVRAVESECAAFWKREGVPVDFRHENIPKVVEKKVSLTLYRIIQEGLRNISKHACAVQVSVSLKGFAREIQLSIQDNGIGFDLAEARVTPGLGLSSLRERVRLINGTFSIQSRSGEGTFITVRVPLTPKGTENEKTTNSIGR